MTVQAGDTNWVALGEWVYVDDAGGPGVAGQLVVTSKTPTTLTLFNPTPTTYPLASTSTDGLLRKVSGLASDFIDGTNNCQPIANLIPAGTVWETARSTAPSGWILCDGASYTTAGQPSLFAAIGYTFGGSGANFNVPDCRGKVTVGAGQGTSLTNRLLGATGGEESHQLSITELAAHTHIQNAHSHTDSGHNHAVGNAAFVAPGASGNFTIAGTTAAGNWGVLNGVAVIQNATATNQNTGSGTPHNNMSPFAVLNKIIKT